MSEIFKKINLSLNDAIKAKNSDRVLTLRSIVSQKKDKEIRYSKKNDFTATVAEEFIQNHQHDSFSHDFKLLKDPFLLREKEFLS